MRASKAYLAGLGTTGVLLAASVALLFFVGALVGFDRWPGGDLGNRVERVELRPGEQAIGVADAVAPTAVLPAAAGPLALAVPAPGGPPAGPGPVTVGTPPVLGDTEGGGAPGVPLPGAPAPANPVEDIGPRIDPGNPESARDVVADTTQRAAGDLGAAVGQVSPEAGELIAGIGGGLAEGVRGVDLTR